MTRAEEAAKKIFKDDMTFDGPRDHDNNFVIPPEKLVGILQEAAKWGYIGAQQYFIALIQSRIDEILGDAQPYPILRMELQELIKKIEK